MPNEMEWKGIQKLSRGLDIQKDHQKLHVVL